jgi:hypothetical protein
MNTNRLGWESNETPNERVSHLSGFKQEALLEMIVQTIIAEKNTRAIPDLLHDAGLLSDFEVYDADYAWDQR